MSEVFTNELRKFTSDITGEEREYKVNNSVWLHINEQFDMTQEEVDEGVQKNDILTMVKFTTAAMMANGLDVTYEEVGENTHSENVIIFYNKYFDVAFGVDEDSEEQEKNENK